MESLTMTMNLTNRLGRQNSLIRRVRQHGALTTLFRTVDERTPAPLTVGMAFTPPAPTQVLEPTDEWHAPFPEAPAEQPLAASPRSIESPAVQQPAPTPLSSPSQLIEAGNRERISPLVPPLGQLSSVPGAPPVPAATTPSARQPMPGSVNTPPPPTVAPAVAPAATPTGAAPAPPLQRAPAPEQATSSGMDDATWTRLRAIVRKHQARDATEGTQDVAVSPVLGPQTAATMVQRMPADPAPVAQKTSTAGPAETSAAIPMTAPAATHIVPAVQLVQRQPVEPPSVASGLPAALALKEAPLPQPAPLPPAVNESTAPPVTADQLPAMTAAAASDEPAADKSAATDWMRPAVPQAPLQAVWPVQRLADTDAEAISPTTSELPAYVGPPPPEPPELRRQLSTLPTAQPTESSLELVLPRRPRPVRPGTAAPTSPATPGDALAVQRQIAPTAAPATAGSLPSVVGTVETEIGPLPADLWQLIGEKPPQQVAPTLPAANTAPVQRAPMAYSPGVTDDPPTPTIAAPKSVTPADDSATATSHLAAVAMAATSVAPTLSPLTQAPQPGQNAFVVERSALSGVSDPTPALAINQMVHQEVAPVTNGGAFPTAALPAENAPPSEKKTRSTRQAHPQAKTSRRRRKRVAPT